MAVAFAEKCYFVYDSFVRLTASYSVLRSRSMPLRDHFRSPVDDNHAWNELHAGWPMMIVQHLYRILPEGFVAAPSVHLGAEYEIDIGVLEGQNRPSPMVRGVGSATAVAPSPTLTIETDLSDQDEYEVRIYDARHGRRLVAAIELVSPRNKDRPESRRAFVGKVAALLQDEICVSIVDLVSIRHYSLYAELLEFIGKSDPSLGMVPPHLYAVTLRARERLPRTKSKLDLWHYPMFANQVLPILPILLEPELRVLLPLEESYEETCKLLHIK